MTVESIEHAAQVAELLASRAAHEDSTNAGRLAAWRARYPYRTVEAPAPVNPPSLPATRSSLADTATVTPIRKARGK